MIRIVLFLLAIALAAAGSAWVAEQTGDVTLNWGAWRVQTSLAVFALAVGIAIFAGVLFWGILSELVRAPARIRRRRRDRHHARARHAITHGLLAVGHGDTAAARRHAATARRHAANDPLALLLHAQSAQLHGDRDGAKAAFRAMAEREDTRLLGLRGLFVEAQRADDLVAAVMIADEALRISPSSTWASQAVLGFRCSKGDWNGALTILGNNLDTGLIDKPTYRRHRGVLLTARALELQNHDRDVARESAMEAVRLAPTLVPAAVLAAKFESEAHQVRRAMRIVEAAWLAEPHPDLADAYAHVRLGDSARQRLVRVEALAVKTPGHIEGALAIARAAIDAAEFTRAREALKPFLEQPTQRVAMLMSELERTEHGDSGRARAWTLRAVRASHDAMWIADGYVSDRWRPISPVTGRIDAFRWQAPVAALPSARGVEIDISPFEEAMLAAPVPPRPPLASGQSLVEPPRDPPVEPAPEPAAQDNTPPADKPAEPPASARAAAPAPAVVSVPTVAPAPTVAPVPAVTAAPAAAPAPAVVPAAATPAAPAATPAPTTPPPAVTQASATVVAPAAVVAAVAPSSPPGDLRAPPPMFRARADLAGAGYPRIPAVIPIVRAPDDPGIDEELPMIDEFAEQLNSPKFQASGWRGFWSRFGD